MRPRPFLLLLVGVALALMAAGEADAKEPLWSYDTGNGVGSVAISADGEYIAVGSGNDTVYLFDKDSSTPLWSYTTGDWVRSVAISADGEYITAGGYDGNRVYLFDKDSSTPLWSYETGGYVRAVAISADGEYIAAGSYDEKVYHFENNYPPIAPIDSISPSPARFDEEVTFSGSGADNDGTIIAYEWESDIDGFLSDEEDFSATGFSVGNHTISFRVQDNDGEWSEWNTAALVVNPNAPPVATIESITPLPARFDAEVTFSGSSSDSDGTVMAYEWNSSQDGFLSDEEDFSITGLSVGNHTIHFRVQDNDGEWSEWNTAALVVNPNAPPVATIDFITPSPAQFHAEVTFNGSGADSDGTVVAYEWNSSIDGFLSDEEDFSTTGFSSGYHSISFRVQDNDGNWSWNSMTLFVKPDPPPVAYAESAEFQNTEDGYQIVLDGYGTDDNELVEYEWRAKNVESQEFAFTNSYDFSSPGNRADNILENPFAIDRNFVFSLRVKDEYGVWSDWAAVPNWVYTDDGDGYDHSIDEFPLDPTQWSDRDADGFGDNPSGNNPDAFPDNYGEWLDTDGDGIGDNSDALVSIPNNYAYFSAAVVAVSLGAVVMEIRARNSLATTRNKLNKLIEEGIDNPEVLASIDGLDKLSGMALMSSSRRDASSLLAETLARQDKLLEALEKVEILQNETSEMKMEDIHMDDFLKNISKLEKQLLKEAKDDFGEEYLENINKKLLDRMSEGAKK